MATIYRLRRPRTMLPNQLPDLCLCRHRTIRGALRCKTAGDFLYPGDLASGLVAVMARDAGFARWRPLSDAEDAILREATG